MHMHAYACMACIFHSLGEPILGTIPSGGGGGVKFAVNPGPQNIHVHIEKQNVEPRCLADDLLFVAGGSGHRARAITAMKQSRQFFVDMGAQVATNKCFMFATHSHTRKFLAEYKWDDQCLKILVCSNFRDLGTHLNLTNSANGSTLTKRMLKAIKNLSILSGCPYPYSRRRKF